MINNTKVDIKRIYDISNKVVIELSRVMTLRKHLKVIKVRRYKVIGRWLKNKWWGCYTIYSLWRETKYKNYHHDWSNEHTEEEGDARGKKKK